MFNYVLVVMTTNNNVTTEETTVFSDRNVAMSQFYSVCSQAVLSTDDVVGVVVLGNTGFLEAKQTFEHYNPEPEEDVDNPVEG